ncbi:hypothetical protein GBAR_LOCUS23671, partial [Geodia barretti]
MKALFYFLTITILLWVEFGAAQQDAECTRVRKYISVDWPDCEPAYTKVPTCDGTCRSYDVVIPTPPYLQKDCNCCKSEQHSVKKRQLSFLCNGRMENHTVFLPIIDKCRCAQCQVSIIHVDT